MYSLELDRKTQGKKLEKALNYIKAYKSDKTDKKILLTLQTEYGVDIDSTYLSRMKKGEKAIKEELVYCLRDEYGINPDYILGESRCMRDMLEPQFEGFTLFAKNWMKININKTSEEWRLCIEADSNLYRFLLKNPELSFRVENDDLDEDTIIYRDRGEDLRYKNPDYQRYILIPEKDVIKTNEDFDLKLFETKLSLLEKEYKSIEARVMSFEKQRTEEVNDMVSEIHKKINEISELKKKLKKDKNK